jgi:hypothetical protein
MLQRKQTLYLLVSALLLLFATLTPFIENSEIVFTSFAIKQKIADNPLVLQTFPIGIFLIILIIFHLFCIFLFTNRLIQLRFVIFSFILTFGFYGILLFYHFMSKDKFNLEFYMYSYSLVSPLLAIVFDFMAMKGIQKDEKLVRDADRLR